MEEKEFNALVGKIEETTSKKINEQVKEALKEVNTDALKELMNKELITKEDVITLLKGEEFNKVNEQVNELVEQMKEVKDNLNTPSKVVRMKDALKAKMQDIIDVSKGIKKEVVIKANTVRANVASSTQGTYLNSIGQLGAIKRSLYDIFQKIQITDKNNNGSIKYIDWDETTTVRAAAAVAEGATFPESTAKFVEKTLDINKVGDTLPVSEEFGEDQELAASELEMFLNVNVESEIDKQIAIGDGTGQNLKGLNASVPAYTPVASGITAPTVRDLVVKVKNAITKTRGSKYNPDFVALNSTTFEDVQFAKDANNNLIFNELTNTLGGCEVVIDNNLTDNTLVVGDRRYARIYEKTGVEISRGRVVTQFTDDMETIKARKRLAFLIREADKTGFLKVTDVDAALVTLGQ